MNGINLMESWNCSGWKSQDTSHEVMELFIWKSQDTSHRLMELFRLEAPEYIPRNRGAVQIGKARIHPMESWSCSGWKPQDTSHGVVELFRLEKPGYIPWNHGAVQVGKARIHPMESWSCSGWKSQDTSHGVMELFRLEKPGYIPWSHGAVQVGKARIHPMESWSCSGWKSQDTSHGVMELFRLEKPGYIPWSHGAVQVGSPKIHPMDVSCGAVHLEKPSEILQCSHAQATSAPCPQVPRAQAVKCPRDGHSALPWAAVPVPDLSHEIFASSQAALWQQPRPGPTPLWILWLKLPPGIRKSLFFPAPHSNKKLGFLSSAFQGCFISLIHSILSLPC
ncbi:uncharacterized protein LOC127059878 isoform X42 [Serinus canaria]|uniref:uncharacterized protein LOC127059878 isoform X42 n=1 Tax=Serinus canaria TaxID=9135 RepID=UPI0021CCDAFB|nr:uncharacterized protein LOC127059878 isoform X42 [Serinus canaria]